MQRRTWQLLVTVALAFGCGSNPEPPEDPVKGATCSNKTKCPHGYKCTNDPGDPHSTGKCEYQVCGLTDLCKKPHKECPLPVETAMCDKFDNDKYCECVRPNSEEVPTTPTTGDPPPTTGKP